ncbi:MAG: D-alanyl-D-alanine carboxypeptidase family protein [Christensenellales bacterium]
MGPGGGYRLEDNQNLDISQEETDEQQWLMKNCWKYGFILRYPTTKTTLPISITSRGIIVMSALRPPSKS